MKSSILRFVLPTGLLLSASIQPSIAADNAEPMSPSILAPSPIRRLASNANWYRDCRAWSTLSLVAAHALDTASSWGGVEANPVLNGGHPSRFGIKGMSLKFSLTGGYLGLQTIFMKKYHESRKAWCAANYAGAAAVGATAIRNLSAPH
jgi:hypothetical protein